MTGWRRYTSDILAKLARPTCSRFLHWPRFRGRLALVHAGTRASETSPSIGTRWFGKRARRDSKDCCARPRFFVFMGWRTYWGMTMPCLEMRDGCFGSRSEGFGVPTCPCGFGATARGWTRASLRAYNGTRADSGRTFRMGPRATQRSRAGCSGRSSADPERSRSSPDFAHASSRRSITRARNARARPGYEWHRSGARRRW